MSPYLGRARIDDGFLRGPYTFTIDGENWTVDGADALEMGMLLRLPAALFDEPDHHALEWGEA